MKASVRVESSEVEVPFFLGKIEHVDGRVTFQEFVTHGEARRLAAWDRTVVKISKSLSPQEEAVIFQRE